MYERRNRRGAVILLAGVALFALFAGMGVREIESGDETRVAGIAAEMFLNRNFLVLVYITMRDLKRKPLPPELFHYEHAISGGIVLIRF